MRVMTAEQLLQYSHEPYQQELIDGILYEMEPPGQGHGRVAMHVGSSLYAHVVEHDLGMTFGEAGFQLTWNPDTVLGPDVAFVAKRRDAPAISDRGYWQGPPDLAIEIVSPNDRRSQVEGKALAWLRHGTRAVVVLDPPLRTATVYRARDDVRILMADEALDLSDVVPGWAPLVGDFFAF